MKQRRKRHILWIHGWGMSPAIWGDVNALLPGFGHHFFTYQGCDTVEAFQQALESQLSEAASIKTGADAASGADPAACADGTGGSWIIIGWSLGGMLALEHLFQFVKRPQTACALEAVVVVAGTLCFVNANRQLGWPARVLERMRKQLRLQPEETLRQFALSMFTEPERANLPMDWQAGLLADQPIDLPVESQTNLLSDRPDHQTNLPADHQPANLHYERLAGLLREQQTDFSLSGLDAGLAYLQNTDLTAPWQEYCHRAFVATEPSPPRLLWMHGESDPINPCAAMPDLNRAGQTMRQFMEQVVFPDAGHVPFQTQQSQFYAQLRSFFE